MMFIEGLCFNGKGMNQKTAYAKNVARLQSAQHGVLQQSNADASALAGFIDRKTAKNGDRHRIWHIATHRGRRIAQYQRPRGKTVISDNLGAIGDNIGARCYADLVRARAPLEPVIKAIDTAGKVIKQMFRH